MLVERIRFMAWNASALSKSDAVPALHVCNCVGAAAAASLASGKYCKLDTLRRLASMLCKRSSYSLSLALSLSLSFASITRTCGTRMPLPLLFPLQATCSALHAFGGGPRAWAGSSVAACCSSLSASASRLCCSSCVGVHAQRLCLSSANASLLAYLLAPDASSRRLALARLSDSLRTPLLHSARMQINHASFFLLRFFNLLRFCSF